MVVVHPEESLLLEHAAGKAFGRSVTERAMTVFADRSGRRSPLGGIESLSMVPWGFCCTYDLGGRG